MPDKSSSNTPDRIRQELALKSIQEWLKSLYRNNLANFDDKGVVRISETVARRFSLGIINDDVFVAIGDEEMIWAKDMPWEYAAVYEGKKDLHLVCLPIELGDIVTAPFGMSFAMKSVAEAASLTTYGTLQLRSVGPGQKKESNPLVSRLPFAKLPIFMLGEDEAIFEAVARIPAQLRNKGNR